MIEPNVKPEWFHYMQTMHTFSVTSNSTSRLTCPRTLTNQNAPAQGSHSFSQTQRLIRLHINKGKSHEGQKKIKIKKI